MTLLAKRRNGGLIPSLRTNFSELFDFDRFFDDPLLEANQVWNGVRLAKIPATNILEKENEFVVELAAPGMKKKDFHIDIDDNFLEIKVEKEDSSTIKDENYTRKEYDFTSFYRSFTLPENVNSEKIKAEYTDGILRIHLPMVAKSKKKPVKEITIS